MAKLSKIIANDKRKVLVAKFSVRLKTARAILKDPRATPEARRRALAAMAAIPRNAHPSRIRNRCAETGRPRGFLRKFGLSRLAVRKHGLNGHIPGLMKSSW